MNTGIFSLEGKTALVTGASRGIGAAVSLAYAEAGADVAVAARSTGDLEALAGKIEATGRRALAITCDVTDPASVQACVGQTIERLGGIDVLVNNAGGTRFMAPMLTTRLSGWQKGLDLNLNSVFSFCQAVGAHMVERGRGSVINVASVAGLHSTPTLSFYGAAKAAVINLTRTLAVEWGHAGVRVNAISPGWVKTDLNRALWENPEVEANMTSGIPLGRWGETDDLVGAFVWLASDAARWVSGSTIVIDGAQTA